MNTPSGQFPARSVSSLFACFCRWLAVALLCPGISALRAQTTYAWTGTTSDQVGDSSNWQNNMGLAYNADTGTYGTGQEWLAFGDTLQPQVNYSGSLNVYGLDFSGGLSYQLHGPSDDSFNSLYIGTGGIAYHPSAAVSSQIQGSVTPTVDQTWNIANGRLELQGPIKEQVTNDTNQPFTLTKTGAGTLALYGPTDWSTYIGYDSTIRLNEGRLEVRTSASTALGDATIDFNGGTLVAISDTNTNSDGQGHAQGGLDSDNNGSALYLNNNIISHGLISVLTDEDLHLGYSGEGSTTITLAADTTIQTKGSQLFLDGDIVGDHKLTLDALAVVVLNGNNTYTGGTAANKGLLAFGQASAIPNQQPDYSGGLLQAGDLGYISIAFTPGQGLASIAAFLGYFDKTNTTGTIGFDAQNDNQTPVFSDAIDLTGFAASARLGSVTRAVLAGDITPQGADYRFGGGGGLLVVSSPLPDINGPASRLVAESPIITPLTLAVGTMTIDGESGDASPVFPTTNLSTFTGGVSATNSAVIFGPNAMPASGDFNLGEASYIGDAYTDPNDHHITNVSDFIARFPTSTAQGMIGFDYFGSGQVSAVVTDNIDLSRFTEPVYLGTASMARLDAGITITTTNGGNDPYRFAAYKGGDLEVAATLTGDRSVIIGDPNSPPTFGDYLRGEPSKVRLTADNSYTGGTTLYAGKLFVSQTTEGGATTALGTGPLTVNPFTFPSIITETFGDSTSAHDDNGSPAPELASDSETLTIANPIVLNTELGLAGGQNIELSGPISGSGSLYVENGTTLNLAHEINTFAGGVYLEGYSNLNVMTDQAFGTGPLAFGDYGGGTVDFYSSNPAIGGLSGGNSNTYNYLETELANTTLTINQASDSSFSGYIESGYYTQSESQSDSYSLRLIKEGTGTLTLNDGSYFSNGTNESSLDANVNLQINAGTVLLRQNFNLWDSTQTSPTIWVHGGILAADAEKTISNPVVVDNNGRLAGFGTFAADTSIGTGAILSPGLAGYGQVGRLAFYHLELNGGGTYEFNIANTQALASGLGQDRISVVENPDTGNNQTLVINATANDPFNIRVTSLDSSGNLGPLAGFDPSQAYSWTLIDYNALQLGPGADIATLFTVDHTNFLNSLAFDTRGEGYFNVSLSEGTNQLMLSFTPVPEPSTYALLGLGLSIVGWSVRRRRRAVRQERI